jgi:competence protein ComGE
MWLKNDGFFFAELLLSLSAWLLATTILLPLTMLLIGQSVELRQEADATFLIYDRLQQLKLNSESLLSNDSVERAGTVYKFITLNQGSANVKEVCVEFDGYFKGQTSKCILAE